MPVVEAVRDERISIRLSSSAHDDLRWLAEQLGVPKTVAAAVAIALGAKTLQRHMLLGSAEVEQLLASSGGSHAKAVRPDPLPVVAPGKPRPAQQIQTPKMKRRH